MSAWNRDPYPDDSLPLWLWLLFLATLAFCGYLLAVEVWADLEAAWRCSCWTKGPRPLAPLVYWWSR